MFLSFFFPLPLFPFIYGPLRCVQGSSFVLLALQFCSAHYCSRIISLYWQFQHLKGAKSVFYIEPDQQDLWSTNKQCMLYILFVAQINKTVYPTKHMFSQLLWRTDSEWRLLIDSSENVHRSTLTVKHHIMAIVFPHHLKVASAFQCGMESSP